MMSEDACDMVVGSPDSGVEEAIASSFGCLLLDNESKDFKKDETDETRELSGDGSNPVVANVCVKKIDRGLSVSSEETAPSGPEERGTLNIAFARTDRVAIIKELLETYFSDNYLTRDIFLLKHFRKSKEGWISLKFMASYKRIKRTAKSLNEVEEAIRQSSLLEINVEGNKVRRLAPLPACIEEYIPSRTVLVGELPQGLKQLMNLSQYFGRFGIVSSMHLLRPGANLPNLLRDVSLTIPKIREQWCAVVEFDEITTASHVTEIINSGSDKTGPGWALELVMPWRSGKICEHPEPGRSLCRSCPSSGYSSPSVTPEQSPIVDSRSRSFRGLTKRERIVLNRPRHNCCHSCACQHQYQRYNHHFSSTFRKHYFREAQKMNDGGSYSPRRHITQLTAATCDNWRAPSPPQ
ncbi:la-related protein 6-like [Panulirus ornatus]|uniref:la-related protein 6-like n=1 Tax=Panulirus ornatus TaxID=150431 RepID=UPI003A84DFBA